MEPRQVVPSLSPRRLLCLGILLLAFALRCVGLGTQELRGDEAFGYFFSLSSPLAIVEQTLDLQEPHPVASYWLQHWWLRVAGASEYALRYQGVWWGLLAVALLLPMAAALRLSPRVGVIATLLLALSPYAVWHAQDARMYSMSLALTLASSLTAVAWWDAARVRTQMWLGVGYVAVTWLALQTHYFAVYVVAAQQLALLGWAFAGRDWGKLARWWLVGAILLLLWSPWLWAARAILQGYTGNGDSPGLVDAIVRGHSAFGAGESLGVAWRWPISLLLLGSVGLGVWTLWGSTRPAARRTLWFLVVYWLIPLAATWLSALNRPIFNERYLVAAVPPVYLLVAAAVDAPAKRVVPWLRWLGPTLIAAICVTMVVGLVRQGTDPAFSKTRGWRELAAALDTMSQGTDVARVRLVQNYPDPTLWYYYQGTVPHLVLPPAAHDRRGAEDEVARLVEADVGRVLLIEQPSPAWDDNAIARTVLQAAYHDAGESFVVGWPVSWWLLPTQPLEPLDIAYEDGLRLVGAWTTPSAVRPGSLVEVHLAWELGVGAGATQEAVSIQVLDNAGRLVAQSDRPLEMASPTTAQAASYAILLPAMLPPGEYAVIVVVYDPGEAGAPRRVTLQGEDAVQIGKVFVTNSERVDGMDGR